jgi:hypothetical protein
MNFIFEMINLNCEKNLNIYIAIKSRLKILFNGFLSCIAWVKEEYIQEIMTIM